MHTVELEHALKVARTLGYTLREEWLGGAGGGACEIKGRKVLFLDLAQAPQDQFDQVLELLRRDDACQKVAMPADLARLLPQRKSA